MAVGAAAAQAVDVLEVVEVGSAPPPCVVESHRVHSAQLAGRVVRPPEWKWRISRRLQINQQTDADASRKVTTVQVERGTRLSARPC